MTCLDNNEIFNTNLGETVSKDIRYIKGTSMDVPTFRMDESQLQRLEAACKSEPKKTIKGRITDMLFGRAFMLICFGGYLWVSSGFSMPNFSKVQRQVLNYDKSSGIVTVDNRGEIENYIFSAGNLLQNGEPQDDTFLDKIKYAIQLGSEFPVEKGIW